MNNLTASTTSIADTPSKSDIQIFTTAATEGDSETISLFLKQWPLHIDAKDEKTWTALMHAARTGQENIVVLLLRHGAHAAETEKFDRTARWFATRNGFPAIATLLQEAMKRSP